MKGVFGQPVWMGFWRIQTVIVKSFGFRLDLGEGRAEARSGKYGRIQVNPFGPFGFRLDCLVCLDPPVWIWSPPFRGTNNPNGPDGRW